MPMEKNSKIYVAGHRGMVGSAIVRELQRQGYNNLVLRTHQELDLTRQADVEVFFKEVDNTHPFKVGLDSCNIPGVVRFCKFILPESLDTCEGGRFSCYIDSDMTMLPCSFDQKRDYAVQLQPMTIEEAWNSPEFDRFREKLKTACPDCDKRELCKGGCPLHPSIVFCNREERTSGRN